MNHDQDRKEKILDEVDLFRALLDELQDLDMAGKAYAESYSTGFEVPSLYQLVRDRYEALALSLEAELRQGKPVSAIS